MRRLKLFVASNRVVTSVFIGRLVQVYNGCKLQNFTVIKNMLGHKFGEYIKTKRCGFAVHISGRKKKGGSKSGRRK